MSRSAAASTPPAPEPQSESGISDIHGLELESLNALELLQWAHRTFGDRLAIASSFGAEDIVLIDLAMQVSKDIRVFTLDTGRLHQETYETIDRVQRHYGIRIDVYAPQSDAVQQLVTEKGYHSFYDSVQARKDCCKIRKLEPLSRALANADAWATGLRRDQNVTRSETRKVSTDAMHGGITKINPLADFTHETIWQHIRDNKLPYNPLHDRGFASIGCAPCTRAIEKDEPERAGRWWWEDASSKECGLHKLPVVTE